MTDIVWEDPPPNGKGRGLGPAAARNAAILAEVKAHPGKWALVSEDIARSVAGQWKKKGCETRTASNGGPNASRGKLYVRWPES
jgi:hypothetical protein